MTFRSFLVRASFFAAAAASLFIVTSCAVKKPQQEKPGWVDEKVKTDGQYLYGAGCAEPRIGNMPFRKSTAYERARVDLAHTIHGYAAENLDGDPAHIRETVEDALPKKETADTWKAPDGTFCARARVKISQVDSLVSGE